MIKSILLDLDDTIFDFQRAERTALSETLLSLGAVPDDATLSLYNGINRAFWQALERGEISREKLLSERFRVLFERLGLPIEPHAAQRTYEKNLSRGHFFMPGAEETLEALHGSYALYMVSNGNASVQSGRLASAGIEKYFDGIFISELIGADKPSPLFFDRCFEKMPGCLRCDSIMVGDSLTSDILGGKNAGILTCWYNPMHAENSGGVLPDYEISSLSGLPELIESIR